VVLDLKFLTSWLQTGRNFKSTNPPHEPVPEIPRLIGEGLPSRQWNEAAPSVCVNRRKLPYPAVAHGFSDLPERASRIAPGVKSW
jgi:hypothetical protein